MVLAKSKKNVGLGNSLMNDRFGKGKGGDLRRGNAGVIQRKGEDGDTVSASRRGQS
jgi:large subunit GTPase 1